MWEQESEGERLGPVRKLKLKVEHSLGPGGAQHFQSLLRLQDGKMVHVRLRDLNMSVCAELQASEFEKFGFGQLKYYWYF